MPQSLGTTVPTCTWWDGWLPLQPLLVFVDSNRPLLTPETCAETPTSILAAEYIPGTHSGICWMYTGCCGSLNRFIWSHPHCRQFLDVRNRTPSYPPLLGTITVLVLNQCNRYISCHHPHFKTQGMLFTVCSSCFKMQHMDT